MLKNKRGITLIALVITIIVLLILAGISINLLAGDNNTINKAEEAKTKTIIAKEQEGVNISYSACQADNLVSRNVTAEELEQEMIRNGYDVTVREDEINLIVTYNDTKHEYTIDQKEKEQETPPTTKEPEMSPEPEGGGVKFDPRYGVIEVKFLRQNTYYTSNTANPPKIDESNGMKLVKFNEDTKEWIDGEEYNYTPSSGANDEKSSKWANAKVTVGDIDSYFVWIPRYAYKITYFDTRAHRDAYRADRTKTTGIVGYSDSRGMVDASGKKIDGIPSYTSIDVGDYYAIHPAFTSDAEIGGGFGELEGIWVGKYETSNSSSTASSIGYSGAKVVPNVKSPLYRYSLIEDMYTNAKSYQSNLYSHMLKNSEWGAAAYLADSNYGRNGSLVGYNQCNSFITGAGPATSGSSYSYNADDFETTYCYYTEQGMKSSTTGNVYGIYDMAGGTLECVACYWTGSESTDAYKKGKSFASKEGISNEYATAYSVKYIRGDDLYETENWNTESAATGGGSQVFLMRSGYAGTSSGSWGMGLFYSSSTDGGGPISGNTSFRMGLIVK